MGLEVNSTLTNMSQTKVIKTLKFSNYKEVFHLKGNKIIDFKLISVDKVILLFLRHLTVIDATS